MWVDANVVLRLLTGQPVAQAQAAAALMARADAGELRLRICPLVVAEVVWVRPRRRRRPLLPRLGVRRARHRGGLLAAKARFAGTSVATFDGDFDSLGVERLALDA